MTFDEDQQLAWALRAGHPLAALERGLERLLIWLGNPDNPSVATLDAAIAASGQSRSVAAERAFDLLDRLLFGPSAEPTRPLGLPPWIDRATARRRYRRLVLAYHPDRHPTRARVLTARVERINLAFAAFERSRSRLLETSAERALGRSGREWTRDTPFGPPPARPESERATETAGALVAAPPTTEPRPQRPAPARHSARPRSNDRLGARRTAGGVAWALLPIALLLAVLVIPLERRASAPAMIPTAQFETAGRATPAISTEVVDAVAAPVVTREVERAERLDPLVAPASVPSERSRTHAMAATTPVAVPAGAVAALPPLEPAEPLRPRTTPVAETRVRALTDNGMDLIAGQVVKVSHIAPPIHATATPRLELSKALTMPDDLEVAIAAEAPVTPPLHPAPVASPVPTKPAGAVTAARVRDDPPAPTGTPMVVDPCVPVPGLLVRFSRAYAAGDLDGLMALYATDVREKNARGRDQIRRLYADWFSTTSARRIDFKTQSKHRESTDTCVTQAWYEASYRNRRGERITHGGSVTFRLEQRNSVMRITGADY